MPKRIKSKITGLANHHQASSLYRDHQHYLESAAITKLSVQPHHSSPSTSSIQTPPGSSGGGGGGGSGKHGSTTSSSSGDGDNITTGGHHNHHHHHNQHHHKSSHHLINVANNHQHNSKKNNNNNTTNSININSSNSQQQLSSTMGHQQHHHSSSLMANGRQRSSNVIQGLQGVSVKNNGYINVNSNDDQSSGLTTTTMTNSITKHNNNNQFSHHHLHHHGSSHNSSSSSSLSSGGNCGGRFLLGVLFTIAELLLFSCITIWLYWSYQHDDGLAWNQDRKQQFNLHAALMLFGFVFLNGQAMLVYRSFQCCNKIYTKILHTILFVLSTSAISLGVILAYSAQENVGIGNKPIMHFYSLHAWIGLVTVGLFVFQFVFGFTSFLILLCCDRATSRFRAALLPIHRTFGLIIFSLAASTSLTGLLQTARSRLSSKLGKIDYHELSEAGLLINAIGVCLIGLVILIPYIIRNSPSKKVKSERLRLSQLDMRI